MMWPCGHDMDRLWLGEHGRVLLGGPDMVYGMSWREWHGIWYCLARYGMVYGVAWRDEMYMVWPGGHDMVYRMV